MYELKNFYCLSCSDTRYDFLCKNFKRCDLPIPEKFQGVKYQAKKVRCCLFGHMAIIMMARCLKLPYVWIFEEDAYPRDNCKEFLLKYLSNLPNNTGIFLAGRNGWKGTYKSVNDNFFQIDGLPFGAHAYMVTQKCYDDVLNAMEASKIADLALSLKYYKEYLPYHSKELLFIQYNIDLDCMSSHRLTKEYKCFYPNSRGFVQTFKDLPEGFTEFNG